jgi:catecholate siderophore receptor
MSNTRVPLSLRAPLLLPATALLFSGAAGATADAVADDATDIVVTGVRTPAANPFEGAAAPYKIDRSASSKLTEAIADTPKSIVVIPKEVIEDLGAQSFRDRIFIRRFDARNDVYIDGLRYPGVTSREIFAVEQVEIVKGPSSTYGGRGTTGGAVSLISKTPQAGDFAILEAAGGNDATRRFTADVNRKLAGTVQLRVNGLWHDSDIAGRDTGYTRRWGAAASLAWQPAPSVDVVADYYHLGSSGLPDWGCRSTCGASGRSMSSAAISTASAPVTSLVATPISPRCGSNGARPTASS